MDSYEEKYLELLLSVGNKYKNETRHQTALRYIKQAEKSTNETAKSTRVREERDEK